MLRKDWEDLQSKGDWFFMPSDHYIVIQWGATHNDVCVLPLFGDNKWQWDGSHEKPTLSPSILVHGKWHGFLREGVLTDA